MYNSRSEVVERVVEIVAEQVNMKPAEISEASNFEEDLRADSLTLAELIMKIEEVFELPDIKEEDADKIKTVGHVIDYICEIKGIS